MTSPLLVKKLYPEARLPTRGSAEAAGYDLYSIETGVIPPNKQALVGTGLAMTVPENCYGRIAPRSGLAVKHSIGILAGVADRDYTAEYRVVMFNHGENDYEYKKGDRIAQLVIERIETPAVVEVVDLSDSVRGENGFGSTGL
jgi:dUTP pyrophosphatase